MLSWIKMKIVQTVIRHSLTAAGAWLIEKGILSSSDEEKLIGAVLTLVAIGHSLWDKREHIKDEISKLLSKNKVTVVLFLVLLSSGNMKADTITETNASGGTTTYTTTNPPTLSGGIQQIADAIANQSTNLFWEIHGMYAPKLKNHYGAGAGVFWNMSEYAYIGVRFDYVDGGFWMPSGSTTLQIPIHVTDEITVTPFTYAGIGVPISGQTVAIPGIGSHTIPGEDTHNGEATAIVGWGISSKFFTYTKDDGSYISLFAAIDQEKWSGFDDYQYRLAIGFHSTGNGLFGLGLKVGTFTF